MASITSSVRLNNAGCTVSRPRTTSSTTAEENPDCSQCEQPSGDLLPALNFPTARWPGSPGMFSASEARSGRSV